MSKLRLPFNGESAPAGSQLCLSERQIGILTKLHSACTATGDIDGQKSSFRKPRVNREPSSIRCRQEKIASINEEMLKFFKKPATDVAMVKFRKTLPCYQKRAEILNCVQNNQVVVISGETGCGKTTQVNTLFPLVITLNAHLSLNNIDLILSSHWSILIT